MVTFTEETQIKRSFDQQWVMTGPWHAARGGNDEARYARRFEFVSNQLELCLS